MSDDAARTPNSAATRRTRRRRWGLGIAVLLVFALGGGAFAVGNYVYQTGTELPCKVDTQDQRNSPEHFSTGDEGPFPGEGWKKWVGVDLSPWWLTDVPYDTVQIPVAPGVDLAAWYIPAPSGSDKTVIVTHGYGASRYDFNALLPSSMLVKAGFNVLLVDQRNSGESTCVSGHHSAGQRESDDFARVAQWLVDTKAANPAKIGMYGVSGGAIATAILPAKTDLVAAFALEAPIFDFTQSAEHEVEFQGFPVWLWSLADLAAKVQGVNLNAVSVRDGIDALHGRPELLLHGTADQRLPYSGGVQYRDYAQSIGADVTLETFDGADHTEGMLTETDRYARVLTGFFQRALQ
ncbi:MAG TPA: alpha/beta fold hydrolase [Microbacteriaceae bacterium]|nr:alpha/beta fold hydrolase [Microbacteriaceae bacterium]